MKAMFLAIFFAMIMLTSCVIDDPGDPGNPGDTFKSEGIITGYDMRECVCCGGWFITIDGVQYRFQELPPESNFSPGYDDFPIEVLLDWELDRTPCMGDEIIVTRIKKK